MKHEHCNCCVLSAFRWREYRRPSIFMSDSHFTHGAESGKTASQIASEAVDRITAETGRNPGSIKGISSHSDRLIEESEARRRMWNGPIKAL